MNVKIIKTNRKTISIIIQNDLTVVVRAPMNMSDREINNLLEKKKLWILKNIERIRNRNEELEKLSCEKLTYDEIKKLRKKAKEIIPTRVEYYSKIIDVSYGRITIRNQKTRWGSCSSKGNLNFNCLLMLMPLEIIDYVVVHELCHRKQMNHSAKFWKEVEAVIPNYKEYKKWLKKEGSVIMQRNLV